MSISNTKVIFIKKIYKKPLKQHYNDFNQCEIPSVPIFKRDNLTSSDMKLIIIKKIISYVYKETASEYLVYFIVYTLFNLFLVITVSLTHAFHIFYLILCHFFYTL